MYAWQVLENGEWNFVGAQVGDMGMIPLVTTRERTFERMRGLAELHRITSGLPVRGVRYGEPDRVEELDGPQ
jgi:hypothetical protein